MENAETIKKPKPKKIFGRVTVSLLNVRKEPTIGSDPLTVISKDTRVLILESPLNSEFYKVSVEGVEGYCMKEFVEVKNNAGK